MSLSDSDLSSKADRIAECGLCAKSATEGGEVEGTDGRAEPRDVTLR